MTNYSDLIALHDRALACLDDGRLDEAARAAAGALAALEVCEVDAGDACAILLNLGWVYEQRGDYPTAEDLCRRALERVGPEAAGVGRPRIQALSRLAGVLRVQGRYREAESIFREALALAERVDPDGLTIARTCNGLAVLYKYTGQFDQARRLYKRALLIVQRERGPDDAEVATLYHNLGGLEHSRGRYARGEPYARKSVAIRTKLLGQDHPDVAADKANLAVLLKRQRRYAEAEPLYRRALSIFETALGADHPDVEACRDNFARLLAEMRQPEPQPEARPAPAQSSAKGSFQGIGPISRRRQRPRRR
jgi:tetratricopeptide (TPR) repeat protein